MDTFLNSIVMKYLIYLKHAYTLLRNEKLFSTIHIVGTGLAISIVMILSLTYYIKIADLYPETNRSRSLVIRSCIVKERQADSQSSGGVSAKFLETFVAGVPHVVAFSMFDTQEGRVQPLDTDEQLPVLIGHVNNGFWEVFSFRFIAGKPFSQADVQSGIRAAVITQSLAERLFENSPEKAVGQEISVDFLDYQVRGVVEDASPLMTESYAQVYLPYSLQSQSNPWDETGFVSTFHSVLLIDDMEYADEVGRQINEYIRRFNVSQEKYEVLLSGQPDRQWRSIFRIYSNVSPDVPGELARLAGLFLVFLLVPAISLSGMTDSRIERRMEELGIRRAFGATRREIMKQVIVENLLFTFLGGIFGLIASWVIFYFSRSWILYFLAGQVFTQEWPEGVEITLNWDMFINLSIFGIALGICVVLNLLSAILPAWKYSRKPIVDSLNLK